MFDIIASIVLYNNNEAKLVESITSFLNTDLSVKIVLSDNSPTDRLKKLADIDERIEYIFNNSNNGFGAGHNVVINKYVDNCRYYLVLNPDIYYNKGEIEKMLAYMDHNVNFGHMLPKVLYPNGEMQLLCKKLPTFFDLFARAFFPPFMKKIFRKRMAAFEYRDKDYNSFFYNVPYLSGCFMLFRSSILKKVGLFDDRIFMYLEDADITRRFLLYSQNVYYPDATIYHHFEKGTYKSKKLMFYTIHAAFIYIWKWRFKRFEIYQEDNKNRISQN